MSTETTDDDKAHAKFDATEAISFLDLVFGEVITGRIGVTAIGKNADGSQWIKNAHHQWARKAVRQTETWHDLKPTGIYFRVTALPPQGVVKGRGGAADSHAINFMWADLDFGGIGHKPPESGPRLPADEAEALTLIKEMPEPSVLIHSGGGLYPIWLFSKPEYLTEENRPRFAKMAERWQAHIKKTASKAGLHYGTEVGNLDRLLRLPGSVNRKEGLERPCRVLEMSERRYEL